jgi:NADH-quinone oxidoreductase subunit E
MHENQQPQTEAFELSEAERAAIEHEMHHYEDPRAASIEALKIVQKQRGWVPDGAIYAIAKVLGIPASDVEGVATFYSQIFRQPVGRHVIRYCDSVVCHITGYQGIQAAIEKNSISSRARPRSMVALLCCQPAAWVTATRGRP